MADWLKNGCRGCFVGACNPATCIAYCAFLLVILSWLNIKPGYVRWLSFLIALDGIITNRIVILIIITWLVLDIFWYFFYHIIFCCLYYICKQLYISHELFYFSSGIALFLLVFERNSKTTWNMFHVYKSFLCFMFSLYVWKFSYFHFTFDTFRLIN